MVWNNIFPFAINSFYFIFSKIVYAYRLKRVYIYKRILLYLHFIKLTTFRGTCNRFNVNHVKLLLFYIIWHVSIIAIKKEFSIHDCTLFSTYIYFFYFTNTNGIFLFLRNKSYLGYIIKYFWMFFFYITQY